jgi:hypothetical protein
MAKLLTDRLNSNADSLVDAVAAALGNAGSSDEERKAFDGELAKAALQYEVAMAGMGVQERLADVADLDSARKYQTQVQTDKDASWLARNVQPMLAVAIMGLTFIMFTFVIYGSTTQGFINSNSKDIVIYILGALTTVATQVVSYFFGSSTGSADKSKTIQQIMDKK